MKYSLSFFGLLVSLLLFVTGCGNTSDKKTMYSQFISSAEKLKVVYSEVREPKDFDVYEEDASLLFEDIAEALVALDSLSPQEQNFSQTDAEKELFFDIHSNMQRILLIPGGEEWLLRCQARAVRFLDWSAKKKLSFR